MQLYHAIIYGMFKILEKRYFCIFPLVHPAFLWYIESKGRMKKEMEP